MSTKYVRKKCVECRRSWKGTAGKYERCDDCGAELVAIPYRNARKTRARR